MLSVAIIIGSIWFALVRALPWPAIPVEQLTAAEAVAMARRTKGLSLMLLLCYVAIGSFGAVVIGWALHFIPDIIAPGSGGSAQMLLALFVVPVVVAGGAILFTGIAGVIASWRHFNNAPQ